MAIPKVIYQTFKTNKIPWLTRFYIWKFMRKNSGYSYAFYDDQQVELFFKENFEERTYKAYCSLQIGAAKADFFRYAILYKQGGVYLDLDSNILKKLDNYITSDDVAVISKERKYQHLYAQWALIFEKGHPFLKRTIDYIVDNIENNRFPNDVHAMTGPTVYSLAIDDEISENPTVKYRVFKDDYSGIFQFKYKLAKVLIYGDRKNHWRKLQQRIPVLKENIHS